MLNFFTEMAQDYKKQIDHAVEPPKIYIASCGVLCDVFWWARRKPEPPAPPTDKPIP